MHRLQEAVSTGNPPWGQLCQHYPSQTRISPVLCLRSCSLRTRNQVKPESPSWPVLERIFPTWWRMIYPVVIHVNLTHWSTPSCMWTAWGTKYLGHTLWQPGKVLAWKPSTHRSEPAPPVKCTERNFQSFHSRAGDAVAYTPQRGRGAHQELRNGPIINVTFRSFTVAQSFTVNRWLS